MLVKISGSSEPGTKDFKLKLNIPFIYLDKEDYTISVRRMSFKCVKDPGAVFFSLHTSAVDRSLINPDQEVALVYNRGSSYIYSHPPTPLIYKVQIKEIHTAEFKLRTSVDITENKIENFVAIIEILRDVRIQ